LMSASERLWAAVALLQIRSWAEVVLVESQIMVMLVDLYPCCCFAKLAAWALTAEDRDQLASVGLPTLRASRCLLLQVIVLRHGSLDLETLAARCALEFIDGHHSTS
jgi:hypothetical protein